MSAKANPEHALADAPMDPAQAEERWRVTTLKSFDVLDTPCEEVFDRITRVAQLAIGTPMAAVSLVDTDRQWFKSRIGVEAEEIPRDISFCTHTIERKTVMVIEDAERDPIFAGSPLVTGPPFIRFYAGAPLIALNGQRIGALCTMDTRPRILSELERNLLVDLAAMVVRELELRRIASYDVLTGACARGHFFGLAEKELARAGRYQTACAVFVMDIDHFRAINDTWGNAVGDRVLREVVDACQNALRAHDLIGRLGGEEFAALLPQTDGEGAVVVAERVRRMFESLKLTIEGESIAFTASFGVAAMKGPEDTAKAMIERADDALYAAKRGGRNRVVIAE
jgi:diguanylate cyclase (GGDEF)-like protein